MRARDCRAAPAIEEAEGGGSSIDTEWRLVQVAAVPFDRDRTASIAAVVRTVQMAGSAHDPWVFVLMMCVRDLPVSRNRNGGGQRVPHWGLVRAGRAGARLRPVTTYR